MAQVSYRWVSYIKKRVHTFYFIRIFFIRITEAQIWSKIIPKTAKNLLAEKKTSPNETVHRKKHFKHSFGGRGRWEIRKKDENFKNILRLRKKSTILIKKIVYVINVYKGQL